MGKCNLLQLITGLGMGGAEKVVFDLAKYISKTDFNTYVLGISKRDELLNEFLQNGINTTILRKDNKLKNIFSIFKNLNAFVKKNNIEIIHAHMVHALIFASLLKVFNPSIKIVYTSHNINVGSKLREFIIWSLKIFRDIDIVFSKDILKYFYKKQYRVIPNGIKISKYNLNSKKNQKFTFISIGRLEVVKNHKFLIEVVNQLKDKFDFELQIVGHGYLKKELTELIEKYKLQNIVKLLGLRNDIPELLNQAHCLLMPSLWEGLPIVILEAGASSLPIISTPVGSIPSLLNDKNSYVVELNDFKNTMIQIMSNFDKAKKKSIKLFTEMQAKYSIEVVVKKHETIYLELKR